MMPSVQLNSSVGHFTFTDSWVLQGAQSTVSAGNILSSVSPFAHLTGVSQTLSIGSLGKTIQKPLLGVAGTVVVGTLVGKLDKALTGVQAVISLGHLVPLDQKLLQGVSQTLSIGNIVPGVSTRPSNLFGSHLVAYAGSLVPDPGGKLTGAQVVQSAGLVIGKDIPSLQGVLATLRAGNILISGAANAHLNGVGLTLSLGHIITSGLRGNTLTLGSGHLFGEVDYRILGNQLQLLVGEMIGTGGQIFGPDPRYIAKGNKLDNVKESDARYTLKSPPRNNSYGGSGSWVLKRTT